MAVVRNLMVRAGADFSALYTQTKKASSAVQNMSNSITKSGAAIKKALGAIGLGVSLAGLISAGKECVEAYNEQAEASAKLAQVMRNTMGATNDEIKSIEDLCSAQQELGVVGDEVQEAGAQELATYLEQTDSLKTLIPVMDDMIAQQYGYEASAESATSIATMMGKVMEGQTSALSRYGYSFTEAQEAILKYGTEEQRAATLADVVEESVGGMNAALAKTPTGRMTQLSNTLGDIKENFGAAITKIGTVFLPVLKKVAAILADIATLANKVAQSIANVFGGKSGDNTAYTYTGVSDSASDLGDSYDDVSSGASDAASSVKDLNNALKKSDIDILHTLGSSTSSSSGSTGSGDTSSGSSDTSSGIKAVSESSEEASESIGWLEEKLEKLKDWLNELGLQDLIDEAKEAFNKIKPVIEDIWENVLKPVGEFLVSTLIDALKDVFDLIGDIGDLLSGKISFGEFLSQLDAFQAALLVLGGVAIINGISTLATTLEGLALVIGQKIGGVIVTVETIAGKLSTLGAGGAAASAGMGEAATGATVLSGALTAGLVVGIGATVVAGAEAIKCYDEYTDSLYEGADSSDEAKDAVIRLNEQLAKEQEEYNGLVDSGGATDDVEQRMTATRIALSKATEDYTTLCEAEGKEVDESIVSSNKHESVLTKVKEAFGKLGESCKSAGETLKEKWNGMGDWFSTNVADPVKEKTSTMWGDAKGKATEAWNGVKSAWGNAKEWFSSLGTNIGNAFQSAISAVKSKLESFASTVQSILEKIKSTIQGIVSTFNTVANSVQQKASSLISSVSSTISGISSRISSVSISLPHLASGAVIPPNAEFAAVLGDQAHGTNIETPENLLRTIFREEVGSANNETVDLMRDILSAVKSGKTIEVNGRVLGQTTKRSLAQMTRVYG